MKSRGEAIVARMVAADLHTATALAHAAGVSRHTATKVMHGGTVSLAVASKIVAALGRDLVEGDLFVSVAK